MEKSQSNHFSKVKKRDESFAENIATKIWEEEPSEGNPYIASSCYCHGYNLLELMQKRSFLDVLFLLFRGELPSRRERELLEQLMIGFINPGPRHPATRAAMNAGVGKTDATLILPIGMSIFGGKFQAAGEVEAAMRWMRKQVKKDPGETAKFLVNKIDRELTEGDIDLAPGFGSHFGGVDIMSTSIADEIQKLEGAGELLSWGNKFSKCLSSEGLGWRNSGVVAATLGDLGFQPRMGPGLFQIMSAPGLFAHGYEMYSKPLTAMPFPDDANYHINYEEPLSHGEID